MRTDGYKGICVAWHLNNVYRKFINVHRRILLMRFVAVKGALLRKECHRKSFLVIYATCRERISVKNDKSLTQVFYYEEIRQDIFVQTYLL